MRRHSLVEVLTGAAILALALGFLGYALVAGGHARTGGEGTTLTARFDRIDGISPGAEVRIAGVRVGSVQSSRIDPATFVAELTLRVDGGLRLPADTSAEITSEGLLGGKYVALVPGGSERILAEGGRITETQGSVSLESLLGKFIFSVTGASPNASSSGGGAATTGAANTGTAPPPAAGPPAVAPAPPR